MHRGTRDISVPAWPSTARSAPPHHGLSTAYLGDVLADVKVVEIDGARHFGPNTHPDAVAARVPRGSGHGGGDGDVLTEERARRVVDGARRRAWPRPGRRTPRPGPLGPHHAGEEGGARRR